MAVTGLIWTVFVVVHLYGNLKIFSGPQAFNSYAKWLRSAGSPLLPEGGLLWLMRIVLVIALVSHVLAAATLWWRGRQHGSTATRTQVWRAAWSKRGRFQAAAAALMPATGVVVLVFLPIHIMDLTLGQPGLAAATFAPITDEAVFAYENLIASLERPGMAAFYLLVMCLLSLHVLHGVRTATSDFGVIGNGPRRLFAWIGALAAIAILVGNGAIPILVQLGVLK